MKISNRTKPFSQKPSALVLGLAILASATGLSSCGFFPFGPDQTMKNITGSYSPKSKSTHVWLVKSDGENLKLVSVDRPKTVSDELQGAVEELLHGPDQTDERKGIGTEIPKGTILLGIKEDENKIEVNLSKRFAASAGPTSMETRLRQLARTVRELAEDKDVFVNIEGQRLNATNADGLEIAQPINRQPEFN